MTGGTKPTPGTKLAERFQDAKKSGGVGAANHPGPDRRSKPKLRGNSQLQRRGQP
jgi:hypothetical protein